MERQEELTRIRCHTIHCCYIIRGTDLWRALVILGPNWQSGLDLICTGTSPGRPTSHHHFGLAGPVTLHPSKSCAAWGRQCLAYLWG